MHKLLSSVLLFCALYCKGQDITPLPYIFSNGAGGYSCYRIPAIVRTKNGTLLAFAEARKKNCKDEGDIDLVLKRSSDNGKTWSDMILVWDDSDNTCGNPAPVVDERTGTIHLLMTWNKGEDHIKEINQGASIDTRRVFVTQSADDGAHWTRAKEITASVKRENWGWYATGPCHGIQVQKGPYAGRLVIPCDHGELSVKKGYSHIIYSDDSGATWQLGGRSALERTNESTVAELHNGELMLNMRSSSRDGVRMIAVSTDGGITWPTIQADTALVEPVCQGSLLAYRPKKNKHVLFFSNPAARTRTNMTIKMSTDNGRSWKKSYTVHSGPSAYSDMVMVPGGKVAILYEGGIKKPYEGIAFEVIAPERFR
jgi:sialidase-1